MHVDYLRTAVDLGSSVDRRLAIKYSRRVMMKVAIGLTVLDIICTRVTEQVGVSLEA